MLKILQACVELGEKLGAEFVEARSDDLTLRTLQRTNDTWRDIILKSRAGIGVACYYGGATGYSFTPRGNEKAFEDTVTRAVKMAKASAKATSLKLDFSRRPAIQSSSSDTYSVKIHPRSKELGFKIDLVNRAIESARDSGRNITNVTGRYGELYGHKLFINSEGSLVQWDFEVVDLACSVISKTDKGDLVYGIERAGGTKGLELYNSIESTPEEIGKKAGTRAKEQLK
ncbi:MAG: hypothetical protein ACFE7R_08480, partial [Candidatus Hodarchaeota archaeon]